MKNNQEFIDELENKLNNLQLRVIPKDQRKRKKVNVSVELPNEKGID